MIVLDGRKDTTAERVTFAKAFTDLYADTIEHYLATMIREVRPGVAGGGTACTEQTAHVSLNISRKRVGDPAHWDVVIGI